MLVVSDLQSQGQGQEFSCHLKGNMLLLGLLVINSNLGPSRTV